MRTKVLLLLAVCMAVVVGAEMPGSGVENARDRSAASTERTEAPEIGVSISHPRNWLVEREKFTYSNTRGYTLWRPESGAADEDGGSPEVRVALAYNLEPGEIEARVRERISDHPGVQMRREKVRVGEENLQGVAVGPIPGSTPSTEVYVASKGSVYQINVYGERLDKEGRDLLSTIKFEPPSRSPSSLALKDGGKAESHWVKGENVPTEQERAARGKAAPAGTVTRSASAAEYQIAEGCYRAASTFYVQTQHGWGANRASGDGIPTGFTRVGRPNYWGQYTHGSLGYGRCASTYYTNDMYAVDYPLRRGDYIFSPFRSGTVTFAGRNTSHANYGIFVVIRSADGRYVSMSGHLNSIARGIRPGAKVTADTLIGFAGNTGDPSIPVGEVHLHQAFYRYYSGYYPGREGYKPDGSPYGGRGLQVVRHHYIGRPNVRSGGVHTFGWNATSRIKAKGSLISN